MLRKDIAINYKTDYLLSNFEKELCQTLYSKSKFAIMAQFSSGLGNRGSSLLSHL